MTSESKPLVDVSRHIPDKTRVMLAIEAGGRCEFAGCNDFLFEHHVTLRGGVFGQDAHIIAYSEIGPRAADESGTVEVHNISNLLLLCPGCHKQIDDEPERFPVDVLRQYKLAHETRIRLVTGLGPDMRTEVVQLKANIAGQPVGIPAPHVYEAVAPRYPADTQGFVIDLTNLHCEDGTFYASAEKVIRRKVDQLFAAGIDVKGARHLSVFALAPIPMLVLFGAALGNKVAADVYQRHRDTEDWRWKTGGEPVGYGFKKVKNGSASGVAFILSLSGKVAVDQVEGAMSSSPTVYELTLKDQEPRPTYLRLREDLARFGVVYRQALAVIRAAHPALRELAVFPAVPAPVAVVIGRELLPKVDPVLLVHDFDKVNGFQQRVKVNAYDPE
ncbi:MAG: SAVED domain-containing protein [Polyangiaceae bacterium]|nr:SAVED domain-containing protein [Polyangiaceae bacterium]